MRPGSTVKVRSSTAVKPPNLLVSPVNSTRAPRSPVLVMPPLPGRSPRPSSSRHSTRRPLLRCDMRLARPAVAALAAALCLGTLPAASGAASGGTPRAVPRLADPATPGPTVHSSDGRRGPLLAAVSDTGRLAGRSADEGVDPTVTSWQVVPGLTYAAWTVLRPQGPVQLHQLTADLTQPGLVLDQVSGPTVPQRAPLTTWLRADGAVAGVNADFFDIHDTGAPLGVGVDRQRRTLHAPASGWNTTFVVDTAGRARVVQDRLVARVSRRGRAPIGVARLNSPVVPVDGIGLYDRAWGTAPGRPVVDDAPVVREVRIRSGVVRHNRRTLSRGTRIDSQLLVGRGAGARALRSLRVGQRVTVSTALSVPARVAVGGSATLLTGGQLATTDDRELHPRTAVAVDRDAQLLHLLVADGRSPTSAGLTLVQLAELLAVPGRRRGAQPRRRRVLDDGGRRPDRGGGRAQHPVRRPGTARAQRPRVPLDAARALRGLGTRSGRGSEQQRGGRVLHDRGDVGEEARAHLAVDVAVVEGQRQRADVADLQPLVGTRADHPRLPPGGAEAQDRRLAGVDDRRPGVDPEHAHVGDREGAARSSRRAGCGPPARSR